MELTSYVTDWVADLSLDAVPSGVQDLALRHVVDGYGLALSGVAEEGHRIAMAVIRENEGAPRAQVFGTSLRAPSTEAALLNGLSMHAMDYDDTQLSTNPKSAYGLLMHPTAPVLGAAAAAADEVGASGADLLLAFIAGVEVCCRISDAMDSRHYLTGFHTTGTVGASGAAIAAGKLLGLDARGLARALGMAGALGGGLRENFGTMTKPLHAGNAASAGMLAARLARAGFTAAENILEAPRGFYAAAAGGYEADRIDGRLGEPFFFADPGISIKPYPSGSLSHPGADAALDLIVEHDIRPEDVEEALAFTSTASTRALKYPLPQNGLEAKFSFPHCLAMALLRRKVGIAEFADDVVRSEEVQEMMKRCRHVADPEIDARGLQHMDTRIELRLKDGRVLEKTEIAALGHPLKPMSKEQLEAKFLECADLAIAPDAARAALTELWDLRSAVKVEPIHRLLAKPAAV